MRWLNWPTGRLNLDEPITQSWRRCWLNWVRIIQPLERWKFHASERARSIFNQTSTEWENLLTEWETERCLSVQRWPDLSPHWRLEMSQPGLVLSHCPCNCLSWPQWGSPSLTHCMCQHLILHVCSGAVWHHIQSAQIYDFLQLDCTHNQDGNAKRLLSYWRMAYLLTYLL